MKHIDRIFWVDGTDLAKKGFRKRAISYFALGLLVAVTVTGYLTVSAYYNDAKTLASGQVEEFQFSYLKATVVPAYLTNPPDPDDPSPPPRIYAPFFSDSELTRVQNISGVTQMSIAISQHSFSAYGHHELLSIEDGAPLWEDLILTQGRLPENGNEVLAPFSLVDRGAILGQYIEIKKPQTVLPKSYRQDRFIKDTTDPNPVITAEIVGIYQPSSPMISGFIGFIPVNRIEAFADSSSIYMPWPVPNTVFLKLEDPARAQWVITGWMGLYPNVMNIPVPKEFWTQQTAQGLMDKAGSYVSSPMLFNGMISFFLAGMGLFAVLYISFLDRRKEMGIMKTVGINSNHASGTLSLEILFSGFVGTLTGIFFGVFAAGSFLRGISGNPLHISPGNIILGTLVSALILSGASYVPRSMAKQGTVIELLHEKHIPVFRHRLNK